MIRSLRSWVDGWLSRHQLRSCAVGESIRVRGRLWIRGSGEIRLGKRVLLDAMNAPIELHVATGAQILIGDDVYIGGGTSIEAQKSVVIGDRVRISAFCKVLDNHFHPLTGNRALRPSSTEIVIEEDAEIGPRAILLPGARIGRGASVGPGTVVSRRVPPQCTVAGIPAVVQ